MKLIELEETRSQGWRKAENVGEVGVRLQRDREVCRLVYRCFEGNLVLSLGGFRIDQAAFDRANTL